MVDEGVNAVVLSMFAIVIAVVMQLGAALTPAVMRQRLERREGESLAEYVQRSAIHKAEAGREAARTGSDSYRLLLLAFWGLLVILIVTLVASPVHMSWPLFLGVFAAAYLLATWIFAQAKAGKL